MSQSTALFAEEIIGLRVTFWDVAASNSREFSKERTKFSNFIKRKIMETFFIEFFKALIPIGIFAALYAGLCDKRNCRNHQFLGRCRKGSTLTGQTTFEGLVK